MTVIRSSRAYWARCVLAVLVVAVPAMVMLALAPSAAGAQPPAPQNVTVPIRDFAFSTADLMVHTGDSVTWVNEDRAPHDTTTTSAPASFASGPLKQGQSFSYTFGAAGTYSYMCTIHPDMVATVTAMDHPAAAAAPAEEVAPVPAEVPAEAAPAEVPAEEAPAAGDPAAGGAVAPAPGTPPAGTSATSIPAAPAGAQPAPGTTQVVGAAQQGQQLDPLLIIAGIALGVVTLCLLLVSPQSTHRR